MGDIKHFYKIKEDIPKQWEKYYDETDNGYVLNESGIKKMVDQRNNYQKRVDEFRETNIKSSQDNEALEGKISDLATKMDEILNDKIKPPEGATPDQIIDQKIRALSDEKIALEEANKRYQGEITDGLARNQEIVLQNEIRRVVEEVAKPRTKAMPIIINEALKSFKMVDNKIQNIKEGSVQYDEDGKAVTLQDYIVNMAKNQMPFLFENSTGGNAPGSNTGIPGKTMTQTEFKNRSMSDLTLDQKVVKGEITVIPD